MKVLPLTCWIIPEGAPLSPVQGTGLSLGLEVFLLRSRGGVGVDSRFVVLGFTIIGNVTCLAAVHAKIVLSSMILFFLGERSKARTDSVNLHGSVGRLSWSRSRSRSESRSEGVGDRTGSSEDVVDAGVGVDSR